MSQSLIHRTLSLCLAVSFTLALLGGIDGLSQPAREGMMQWAQQSSIQA